MTSIEQAARELALAIEPFIEHGVEQGCDECGGEPPCPEYCCIRKAREALAAYRAAEQESSDARIAE